MTPPSISVEKKFCTTKEAATLLGVSVGTVQQWVESGLLQAWKTAGGHRRVTRESVEALLHKPVRAGGVESWSRDLIESKRRRLRVLVLEDDPDLLILYKIKLSAWPMNPEIVGVPNAVSALIAMGRAMPDMLIVDMRMADGVDSFDMLREMHKAPEMVNTTIVVVSGMDAAEIEARGGVPAGIEVLPKPIPFHRLQDIASQIAAHSPQIASW
jgi:excisionase family DNA binding protein